MAVIRAEKTKDYTVMSNRHLRDKNISLKARGLLSTVFSLPDNWEYSVNGLVALCKESETAVKSCMNELKEYGYLKVTKERGKKGFFEYVYTFYESPTMDIPEVEYPPLENPPMDNPPMDNPPMDVPRVESPEVENIGQLNTNILNTKEQNTKKLNTKNSNVCPEPKKASEPIPSTPPIITLILNTKEEYPIYQNDIDEWAELYPAVDVLQELRKMKGWCKDNPSRRKTKAGIRSFINRWLSKEQDSGRTYRNNSYNNSYNGGTNNGNIGTNTRTDEETQDMLSRYFREQQGQCSVSNM